MTDLTPNRRRIAVVDIIADSTGTELIPPNTRFYGPEDLVMRRIKGSKERERDIQIINDAEHAKRDLQAIRAERAELAARTDAVVQVEDAIRHLCDTVNTLTARMDEYEEQQRAKAEAEEEERNSEPVMLPPGAILEDEGELQTTKHPNPEAAHAVMGNGQEAEEELTHDDDNDDLDLGVLPRAISGPTSHIDPDIPPHPTLVEDQ